MNWSLPAGKALEELIERRRERNAAATTEPPHRRIQTIRQAVITVTSRRTAMTALCGGMVETRGL
jgi:hypothetical protein